MIKAEGYLPVIKQARGYYSNYPIYAALGGGSVPFITISPVGIASGTIVKNNGAQYGPDTPGTTTCGIQEAINALPSCTINDGSNNVVTGKTGSIYLLQGVFSITSTIILPFGSITIQGAGMSSWIPVGSITPFKDYGGTAIVSANTNGILSCPQNSFNNPSTAIFLRNLDFRCVSPSSNATSSTPAVIGLSGMMTGEISNVNVLEVNTGGGIGQKLYKLLSVESGANSDYKYIYNVRAYGGTEGVVFNATHITAINVTGGYTGANVGAVTSCGIMILQNDDCFYANLHAFSCVNGLATNFGNDYNKPVVINGVMFEACTHYLATCFSPTKGTLVINKPEWNSSVNPLTDIPVQIPAAINVITHNEVDRTGLNNPTQTLHITVAPSSSTAGTSPYTYVANQYNALYIITTVGGMTALTLDGQALFNGSFTVGQQVYVAAGHKLVVTWATTAPVFQILPT